MRREAITANGGRAPTAPRSRGAETRHPLLRTLPFPPPRPSLKPSLLPRLRSIPARLTAFAAALVLPILVFVGILLFQFASSERTRLEADALDTARGVAIAIDRELAGLLSALDVLALSPSLQTGDLRAFHDQVAEIDRRRGLIATLRTPDGQQVVNARRPLGSDLPRTSVEGADAIVQEQRRPAVSGVFVGAVVADHLVTIVAPVLRAAGAGDRPGEVMYLLSLSVPATRIRQILLDEQPPPTWLISVIDRSGLILARSQRHDDFVGRTATADLRAGTTGVEGHFASTTIDGQAVLGSYARSRLSDWRVAVGVRTSELNAPLLRSLGWLAGLGLGLALLATVLALGFARWITGPLAALGQRAAALGQGEAVAPLPPSMREVDDVGTALVGAAAALSARERERLVAQAALARSEMRSRLLVEATSAITWRTDPEGRFAEAQPAWAAFTGQDEGAYRDRGWLEAVHPDDRAGTKAAWDEALAEAAPFAVEHRLRRVDGVYRTMIARAVPVRANEDDESPQSAPGAAPGPVREWTGLHADVTEQRAAEAEVLESNEEIQRYAYIVSHDLRAPLVNIMGFTSEIEALRDDMRPLLAGGRADPAAGATIETDLTESIGFIKASISKMDRLINAILKLSREGRRAFRAEALAMTPLMQGLVDAQRHQIVEVDGAVEIGALPDLVADRLAVEQIFANLLDNALKYRDAARPVRVVVTGTSSGPFARYVVADNGRGIAPADHARVFELFRRAGSQDRPGEGIGLAHVRTLVRALGGRIDLASTLGAGTTFTVTLPRGGAPDRPAP